MQSWKWSPWKVFTDAAGLQKGLDCKARVTTKNIITGSSHKDRMGRKALKFLRLQVLVSHHTAHRLPLLHHRRERFPERLHHSGTGFGWTGYTRMLAKHCTASGHLSGHEKDLASLLGLSSVLWRCPSSIWAFLNKDTGTPRRGCPPDKGTALSVVSDRPVAQVTRPPSASPFHTPYFQKTCQCLPPANQLLCVFKERH